MESLAFAHLAKVPSIPGDRCPKPVATGWRLFRGPSKSYFVGALARFLVVVGCVRLDPYDSGGSR